MNHALPESAHISLPPPVAPEDAPKPPKSVSLDEFKAAVTPLLDLVGTTVDAVFAEGFSVTEKQIEFVTCVPVAGVEPIKVGDDPEWAEWGWPVVVQVDVP